MARTDTICALSSGTLPSAIALVRVSGPHVRRLADVHLFHGCPPPREARLVRVFDPTGASIDEGIAVFYEGPASYTGEDMLEVSLHGGIAIVSAVIETFTAHRDVRLAEPGEFTRRALEAGKLDLTEAEAVVDLIEAETRAQREQALRQLDGEMSGTIATWRTALIDALAMIEVAVDFPDEEDAPDFTHRPALERLRPLQIALKEQLGAHQIGEQVRDGFKIALIGPPNAGKSSLINALYGEDAAIVTDIPGTTRDVIEVRMDLGGHLVRIFDTAGLRETTNPIEQEGVRRAKRSAARADLRLLVFDASQPWGAEVQQMADTLKMDDFIILNKIDLVGATTDPPVSRETIAVSTKTGEDLDSLTDRLAGRIRGKVSEGPPPLITRARHRAVLEKAGGSLAAAIEGLEASGPAELIAEDVRRAITHLDALVGRIDVEDVLGAIFSRFCIGK